ncbi:MAG: aminopeptidase N [Gammaproteobacteria bacterium]|nr:aminopeptidase N [Gammaproteobacteria bacterium]
MKNASAPITRYRKDYLPSDFLIDNVSMVFQLDRNKTKVISKFDIRRNPAGDQKANQLFFDGEDLSLKQISFNAELLTNSDYEINDEGLLLKRVADTFELETIVEIDPANNSSLEGLYVSNDKFCTQCEAEGFRKITYYLDRPDVLAKFNVRIEADKSSYPLLLSNGNKIAEGNLGNNQHFVEWEDPFRKPSYLFALVAGDLDLLEDSFTTRSGKEIKLELYVDKGKLDQSEFAMESLKNAMTWDERRYDLEYDLDLYMIVAVGDFNMGAMENKGLNIFNTKYVLANPQTATDQDFENIESVIGHEYFHNWTGNRVTCRDWFQLSLKEGLTVFRDQQFTEDMRSKAVKRIDDVKVIRSYQFAEDAGPMAHPIRPESYMEMNNFYTVTVYNKGAEIIRMMHTLLGESGFQKGMKLYFERHDGSASTCDDFVAAMSDANEFDLEQFKYWYSQAGTPTVSVTYSYNEAEQAITLEFEQNNNHPSAKKPYHIPVKVGLIDHSGKTLSFSFKEEEQVNETIIHLTDAKQTVILNDVNQACVPSLLRDFSAPVKLIVKSTLDDLSTLYAFDPNTFTRWDAGQSLMERAIVEDDSEAFEAVIKGVASIINDGQIDNAFKARAIQLPDYKTLFELDSGISIEELVSRREKLQDKIAESLETEWLELYETGHKSKDNDLSPDSVARRSFKNTALKYLAIAVPEKANELVTEQFERAELMTDEIAALSIAVHSELECKDHLVQSFYDKWKHEALVMDKWFMVQATADNDHVPNRIIELRKDPVFNIKNPNKVRSLISAFASLNFVQFHRLDAAGYHLVADAISEIDQFNAQVAANLAKQFSSAPKLDDVRKMHVKQLLENIKQRDSISKDVYEVVSKTLEQIG